MDSTERFWDRMAKNQDKDIYKFRKINDRIVELSLKYISKNYRVLDIRCGTGEKSVEISRHINHVLAFDISKQAVDIAREREEKSKTGNVDFIKTVLDDDLLWSQPSPNQVIQLLPGDSARFEYGLIYRQFIPGPFSQICKN